MPGSTRHPSIFYKDGLYALLTQRALNAENALVRSISRNDEYTTGYTLHLPAFNLTLTEKISFVFQLPMQRKYWLLSCFIGSIICWFAVRLVPSKKLAAKMGNQYLSNRQVSVLATEEQATMASRMGKLMESVSKNVPWESKCLTEALCVKWLLNRYKIPAVFYLGARLKNHDEDANNQEALQAHAWITVGPYVVTGAPTHLDYRVVATFVTPALEAESIESAG